jgi:ribA/ribD-fused uncharacterized protein
MDISAHRLSAERTRRPKFVFFWKPDDARVGFLSNWSRSSFELEGERFANVEQYVMWRKATTFGDSVTAARILESGNPARVKALGRQVRAFDDAVWHTARVSAAFDGNAAKYGQSTDLRDRLLETRGRILAEASPHDRIWGIGLDVEDPRCRTVARWRGENVLGFVLMAVRDTL